MQLQIFKFSDKTNKKLITVRNMHMNVCFTKCHT